MTLRECACRVPTNYTSPYKPHACVRCGFYINPAWTSNDKTMGAFLHSLGRVLDETPGMLPADENEAWQQFRAHCESRELAGRKRFGHSLLARKNIWEAREEAADGLNYLIFQSLVDRREGNENEDRDLLLTAAYHFYEAYETLLRIQSLRHGVA